MRAKSTCLTLSLLLIAALFLSSGAKEASEKLNQALLSHIASLSSRQYEGRLATTPGDWRAGRYIAEKFSEAGLKPMPGLTWDEDAKPPMVLEEGWRKFFQPFPMAYHRLENPVTFEAKIGKELFSLKLGTDYLPFLDSPQADISAPLVFVGYGINELEAGHDDYKGLDVRGKVVLILRGPATAGKEQYSYSHKALAARRNGAKGVLAVTGPAVAGFERRMGLGASPAVAGFGHISPEENLPGFLLHPAAAERLIKQTGFTLSALQKLIDSGRPAASFNLAVSVTMKVKKSFNPHALAANVIALIQGSSPEAREEFVVVGAHRDAFGTQADSLFFPGADDNASGTAVLIELAAAMKRLLAPKRSVLFVSFSGEEMGLLGSRQFVARLPFPADKIKAMLNIDGVGVGNGKITLGLSKIEQALITRAKKASGIARELQIFGYFPGGDHVPFAEKGIPTITITTSGAHPDLHQVTDTVDKVDGALVADVARLALAIISELANELPPMR